MIWHLKDSGVHRPKDLPDHIERRLRFALARFSGRIGKIFVFLHDWVTAVDRATTRIGHTVARQVERMHDHHAARQRKASGLGLLYGGQE